MKLYNGELTVRNEESDSTVTIASGTPLSEVVNIADLYEIPYMLVLDDAGRLLGIASSIEVLDPTLRRNLRERERWLDMPIDSVMFILGLGRGVTLVSGLIVYRGEPYYCVYS